MFDERHTELENQGLLISNIFELDFLVGNHYKHLSEAKKNRNGYLNDNRWTAFVRLKNDSEKHLIHKLVSKVVFELHESFRNPTQSRVPGSIEQWSLEKDKGASSVSISYNGWGYFDLGIIIHFKKETGKSEPLSLTHMLHFEEKGKWKTIKIPFN